MQVKIISGWSNPGGSTTAHINLTNLFNASGIDCTFYGPHNYHLDKCKSGKLEEIETVDSIIISHFIQINPIGAKKHILSLHETNLFPLNKIKFSGDLIHYVSNSQRKWHKYNYPYVIIPNVVSDLKLSICKEMVAGVIGSIDRHKQTHLSIERALKDGFDRVYLFGEATDKEYYETVIFPLIDNYKVIYAGHVSDKQLIYNSIKAVYHSSQRETFNYIKAECLKTGVIYNGLPSADSDADYTMTNEEILEKWKQLIS